MLAGDIARRAALAIHNAQSTARARRRLAGAAAGPAAPRAAGRARPRLRRGVPAGQLRQRRRRRLLRRAHRRPDALAGVDRRRVRQGRPGRGPHRPGPRRAAGAGARRPVAAAGRRAAQRRDDGGRRPAAVLHARRRDGAAAPRPPGSRAGSTSSSCWPGTSSRCWCARTAPPSWSASSAPRSGWCPRSGWSCTRHRLDPGDALLVYTDGVTERRRGREQFGAERLLAVRGPGGRPAGGAGGRRGARGRGAASPPTPLDDDVALLAVRAAALTRGTGRSRRTTSGSHRRRTLGRRRRRILGADRTRRRGPREEEPDAEARRGRSRSSGSWPTLLLVLFCLGVGIPVTVALTPAQDIVAFGQHITVGRPAARAVAGRPGPAGAGRQHRAGRATRLQVVGPLRPELTHGPGAAQRGRRRRLRPAGRAAGPGRGGRGGHATGSSPGTCSAGSGLLAFTLAAAAGAAALRTLRGAAPAEPARPAATPRCTEIWSYCVRAARRMTVVAVVASGAGLARVRGRWPTPAPRRACATSPRCPSWSAPTTSPRTRWARRSPDTTAR